MKDGLLIIDKPEGWTSHDVVARLRKILGTKKIGHTGTLDPFATGVLVMLVGKATRLARFLHSDEKEYEAVMRFGFETETGDRTGEPRYYRLQPVGSRYDRLQPVEELEEQPVADDAQRSRATPTLDSDSLAKAFETQGQEHLNRVERLSESVITDVLPAFLGEIEQIPPMYSAKKVGGERLYNLARKGTEIERDPVRVTIREIECTGEVSSGEGTKDFGLTVVCSAGTYVRTLAEDIGRKLGIGCHLAELRRIRAGRFAIEQACKLEELEDKEGGSVELLPTKEAVGHLFARELTESEEKSVRHGRRLEGTGREPKGSHEIALLTADGRLAAIGVIDQETGEISPKIVMI